LAATGQRQAIAVQRLLDVWKPQRLVTSPWTRCVATIAPYAKASGAKVKLVEALTEHHHQRSPKKTAAAIEALFDKQLPIAVCTHRPALPTALKQLGQHMPQNLRAVLPSADPFLSPGEVIVCQVARGSERKIVSVEQVKPFDD
jgi:8-oxo-dGTP diphosphatase